MKENNLVYKLQNWHLKNHERLLSGRYITGEKIAPLLEKSNTFCTVDCIGYSVENRPIHALQIGTGKTRVFMWSQMHGNESTTTKAIFDLLLAFKNGTGISEMDTLLEHLTLCIIPILNPDGAYAYTRNNANDIDLNRDAQTRSQPESNILRVVFDQFNPHICFNLHGQRTIYGFEETGTPSVLSFLSPSADVDRSVTLSRKRSMSIITSIYASLSALLPDQIGRYDDSFNLNCVGDTFQHEKVPTVLFEAGHVADDYDREKSREYMFLAIANALMAIIDEKEHIPEDYFAIPEHQKCYCDVLIKNTNKGDVGIQYKEILENGTLQFQPLLSVNEETTAKFGHETLEALSDELKIKFSKKHEITSDIRKLLEDNKITTTL